MSADQFFQVVLLPQGEFARFLRAEAEERRKLLEGLFGTQRFAQAEAWLADQRRATSAAAAAAAGEAVRQAAALVRSAAGAARAGRRAARRGRGRAAAARPPSRSARPRPGSPLAAQAGRDARPGAGAAGGAARRAAAAPGATRSRAGRGRTARPRSSRRCGPSCTPPGRPLPSAPSCRRPGAARSRPPPPAPRSPARSPSSAGPGRRRRRCRSARSGSGAGGAGSRSCAPSRRALAGDLATVRTGTAEADRCRRRTVELDTVLAELPARRAALDRRPRRRARGRGPAAGGAGGGGRSAHRRRRPPGPAGGARAGGGPARGAAAGPRDARVAARQGERRPRGPARRHPLRARRDAARRRRACPVCGSLDHPAPARGPGRAGDPGRRGRGRPGGGAGRAGGPGAGGRPRGRPGDRRRSCEARLGEQVALGLDGLRARLVAAGTEEDALAREAEPGRAAGRRAGPARAGAGRRRDRAGGRCWSSAPAAERRVGRGAGAGRPDGGAGCGTSSTAPPTSPRPSPPPPTAAAACASGPPRRWSRPTAPSGEQARAEQALQEAAAAGGRLPRRRHRSGRRPAGPSGSPRCRTRLRAADDERAAVDALLADPDLDVPLDPPADIAGTAAALRRADVALAEAVGRADAARPTGRPTSPRWCPRCRLPSRRCVPLQARADEVRRLADLVGGRRGEPAADDAVVVRAGGPARGGRGRRERAAAADVAGPLLAGPHRRRPRRGPLRPRPARPRHLDRARPRHRARCPAARRSSPAWPSRSASPTSSPPRPAGRGSRRCSSTRASGRSTSRPSTR